MDQIPVVSNALRLNSSLLNSDLRYLACTASLVRRCSANSKKIFNFPALLEHPRHHSSQSYGPHCQESRRIPTHQSRNTNPALSMFETVLCNKSRNWLRSRRSSHKHHRSPSIGARSPSLLRMHHVPNRTSRSSQTLTATMKFSEYFDPTKATGSCSAVNKGRRLPLRTLARFQDLHNPQQHLQAETFGTNQSQVRVPPFTV